MYRWTKSLCNDYYLWIILPILHMHTFRCYHFQMNDIYLKIWWATCACLYYTALVSAVWVCMKRKMVKLDIKVLWNVSLLRNPESLKAIKVIKRHIQDLLQALLKNQSQKPELLWHRAILSLVRSGKRSHDMLLRQDKWTSLTEGVLVPECFYQIWMRNRIISPCMVLN